ncbi:MAG: murein DD-endopeptidase MepM, partial [Pseudomonadota bacterium]
MFGKKDSAYVMAGVGSEELFVEREAMSAAGLPGADAQVAQWRDRLSKMDWVPDLGEDIGSPRWFRGLATLTLMTIGTLSLLPDFGPIYGAQPAMPTSAQMEEARAQMITPLAYGSDTGRRMAATDAVRALAASPERPRIELTATLGRGDSFARV